MRGDERSRDGERVEERESSRVEESREETRRHTCMTSWETYGTQFDYLNKRC